MARILLAVCIAMVMLAGCDRREAIAEQGKKVEITHGQTSQHFAKKLVVTKELAADYLLYIPNDYGKQEEKWPLIMFLHGSGERGTDINRVKLYGIPKVAASKEDFPFVAVSPQCPKGQWWDEDVVINLLDDIIQTYDIDPDRVYLTGLSMGGFGTWKLATKYPDKFAAIAPVCGGGEPFEAMTSLRKMPIWAFHGGKDNIVPLRRSQEMVDAMKKVGNNARLTVYPKAGHDSWTATYNNDELYKWFLSHKKTRQ
ncbi:MAG: prolyl oligopeptidase family serine peptidase [Anaerohalosphaera sp.]|nr:prolyl oligopeptidase family serine peptidase [Anaerohalosphaera sp.]